MVSERITGSGGRVGEGVKGCWRVRVGGRVGWSLKTWRVEEDTRARTEEDRVREDALGSLMVKGDWGEAAG